MRKWKNFTLLTLVILLAAGLLYLVWRQQKPETTEVERVFDGTEVVFIEGSGLLSRWRILTTTEYVQSRAYEGLEELPAVRDALAAIGGGNGAWIDHVNADAIMSAVGDESALGIYAADGVSRFLFVSRVDPNFLLADRLLAFAGADAGITVTEYRDTRVKEAAFDQGRSILWALDGDFLILSDDREILYAALDRHIDGTVGPIAASREFRRMKAMGERARLISGYLVTKRLDAPGGLAGFLPDAAVLAPDPLFFSVSYADGVITFEAKSIGRIDFSSLFPDNARRQRREPSKGVLAALSTGPMPTTRGNVEESPAQVPDLARLLPLLFPDGFTMFMLGDERCGGPPATVAAGETQPSTKAAIDRLRTIPGITILDPAEAGADFPAVENEGSRLLFAVADRNGRTVVSDRPDLLAGIPAQILETGGGLGYTTAQGEISFTIAPRLLYRELERCGQPIPIPSVTLSGQQQRRLLAALLPAQRIDGYALIEHDRLTIDIAIHIEDAIP